MTARQTGRIAARIPCTTTLTERQEAVVVTLRETLWLPLDDLLFVTRPHINPDVSRSGLARCLKRHGISRLKDVLPQAEGEPVAPTKTFKDYEPGYLHIDIKYLPRMPDEATRRYLFVAIDRAPPAGCFWRSTAT